jgi:hypothetical protein
MATATEDTALIEAAIAYVIELYRELSVENGAPTLGTQNQAVDLILADPALARAIKEWATSAQIDEAKAAPPQRLPVDDTYRRVAAFLRDIMGARFLSTMITTDCSRNLRYTTAIERG